jgi:hypothetical protein
MLWHGPSQENAWSKWIQTKGSESSVRDQITCNQPFFVDQKVLSVSQGTPQQYPQKQNLRRSKIPPAKLCFLVSKQGSNSKELGPTKTLLTWLTDTRHWRDYKNSVMHCAKRCLLWFTWDQSKIADLRELDRWQISSDRKMQTKKRSPLN